MRSPRRNHRDQDGRGDIRDRLQSTTKGGGGRGRRGRNRLTPNTQNTSRITQDRSRNDRSLGRRDSIGRVMERARTEGGARWTKKLLDEEAKHPDRWGHSGFKELYKNELGLRNRQSGSREKEISRRSYSRSKSRDREDRISQTRNRESAANRSKSSPKWTRGRSNSRDRPGTNRRLQKGDNRGIKRSRSSSDRSPAPNRSSRAILNRDRESDHSRPPKVSIGPSSKRSEPTSSKSKLESTRNASSRIESPVKKNCKQSRDWDHSNRDWVSKKRSPSRSRSPTPRRSPARDTNRTTTNKNRSTSTSKQKKGPISPPERSPLSRSSESPAPRRKSQTPSERSSRSKSSTSRSVSSKSRSSSSSSDYSSSSRSSRGSGRIHARRRSPPPSPPRAKERTEPTKKSGSSLQTRYDPVVVSKSVADQARTISKQNSEPRTPIKHCHSESESSSNPSSSESDEAEEGEDREDQEENDCKLTSDPPRLTLSERFGKLAQLSSQRRNFELVQLRIVAPVGANASEKNVSVDESSAAPVISKKMSSSTPRSRSADSPAEMKILEVSEDLPRKEERTRDDHWRDWHERYDHYRHVQPPRELPRDWDDIRVRHKYYTDRGYFGRDMTLDELSRWESWWHRYQQWRRGYERAWVATHGPHVPVEYPDWSNYRSTAAHRETQVAVAAAGSIRSRLGWRPMDLDVTSRRRKF